MTETGSKNTGKFAQLLSLFLLFSIFLSGCHLPEKRSQPTNENGRQPEDFATPATNVQFILELNQPVSEDEEILIEILDEVSGLPHHAYTFALEKTDEEQYNLQMSFPSGSVVKYRYVRLGETKIPEALPTGEPVRYRLCHVMNGIQVVDQLNGWLGDTPTNPRSTLTGTIQDRVTHVPIPDILVSAGGQLSITDANGQFVLEGLPIGVQNLVAYAINGSYQTFQQGAQISPGMTTQADLELQARPVVRVQFNVNPPGDAQGAPVYLAGNLTQLGNTFSELAGSMSLYPKKMPALMHNEDGTYAIDLQLYAGIDLRYKFTLGDGFWNAERTPSGEPLTRQLIVPNHDVSLDLKIESWRATDVDPVTFNLEIPSSNARQDEVFIQFHTDQWTEPIPVWPIGGGDYLYILFSPLHEGESLGYRFCRNSDCQSAKSLASAQGEVQIEPTTSSVDVTIGGWEDWSPIPKEILVTSSVIVPSNPSEYLKFIELTPEMGASWEVYAPIGLSIIAESGASAVIFTPRWHLQAEDDRLQPILGSTPFHYQLKNLLGSAASFNLQRGIFPQIYSTNPALNWWKTLNESKVESERFQESYFRFILNYAKTARLTNAEYLILGGKALLPFYDHPYPEDDFLPTLSKESEDFWIDLITELRSVYTGQILWAAHVHREADPIPEFVSKLDGIYLMVDGPLTDTNQVDSDTISFQFNQLIDNHIYEVHRSTGKPVFVALAYPSVEGSAQGCLLIDQDCANDGLFLRDEMKNLPVDQEEQRLIYSSILPVIASRDWISGTAFRGYQPTVTIQDGSSSIAGKPAMGLIWDWFNRIDNP